LPNDQTKQYSTDTQINHDFSHDKSHGYYTICEKMKTIITVLCILIPTILFAVEPIKAEKEIVGTWQFISVDGRKIPSEFYMKFDADGIAQSWPAPHEGKFKTKNGISTGGYRIDENFFYIVKEKTEDIESRYELSGDSFTMTTDKGNVLVYHRVKNPPPPGELKADQGGVRQ